MIQTSFDGFLIPYEAYFRKFKSSTFRCEALGDLDTLQERLQNEVAMSNTVVPWIGLVAAWCRNPERRKP